MWEEDSYHIIHDVTRYEIVLNPISYLIPKSLVKVD